MRSTGFFIICTCVSPSRFHVPFVGIKIITYLLAPRGMDMDTEGVGVQGMDGITLEFSFGKVRKKKKVGSEN
ncbi:hypothetical protein VTN00DRAFT_2079 [Thermoascus crustaceus]|uniref:uncharacterized protein n=1 Tax=Thermoascus crustaceus TaxID=5088 RepID=UPI00374307EC